MSLSRNAKSYVLNRQDVLILTHPSGTLCQTSALLKDQSKYYTFVATSKGNGTNPEPTVLPLF
jgi:hypothetical protein